MKPLPILLLCLPAAAVATERSAVPAGPPATEQPAERGAVAGPPAICFPLEVAGRTLPWGDGTFAPASGYRLSRLRDQLLPLLDAEDTLTRMENLRRTAILLSPLGKTGTAAERAALRVALLSELRARALEAMLPDEAGEKAPRERVARLLLDLGYLQAALSQILRIDAHAGGPGHGDGARELRMAARLMPDDGAVHLACFLGIFDLRDDVWDRTSLRACVRLAAEDDRLRRNLLSTAGVFLGVSDYDELVDRVDAPLD